MKAVVVGFGSIGARHTRILEELGCEVAVVSRRRIDDRACYDSLETALERHQPHYAVIANETSRHAATLRALANAGFTGTTLIEKPLFDNVDDADAAAHNDDTYVAYNLRFHPLIVRLRELLADEAIVAARVVAGQYLPSWRPSADYRTSYSASREQGGGVLRDLSHELDYCASLFGEWQKLTAVSGRFSNLEIDSDDVTSILMITARVPLVSVWLDYLDRDGRREIAIQTARTTIHADLVRSRLTVDGQTETFQTDRDHTYRAQHQALLSGSPGAACTYAEALGVMQTIQAIEHASQASTWIERGIARGVTR